MAFPPHIYCTTCGYKLQLIHKIISYDPYTGKPVQVDQRICQNMHCSKKNHGWAK